MTASRGLRCSLIGLCLIGLAGCAAPFNGPEDAIFGDERLMYPIRVAPQMESLRVPVGQLTPETDARVATFAKDYLEHGNGALSVNAPAGDEYSRRYFAARLSDLGVPAWRIMFGTNMGADREIELSYIRYAANATPCGDWSKNYGDTSQNLPGPNFGCATQHNIAAMVSDPRDLVAPRREDPADAARRVTVFDKYRKGEPTPAQKTSDQKATISDVKE
ncbi:MAG: CpaD family pilus assembly protein [Alphaproteobacteria bacterium]